MVKGRAYAANLNVPIEGVPPTNGAGRILLSQKGDEAFEHSRKEALKALSKWKKCLTTDNKKLKEDFISRAYKAKTGISLEGIPLTKLYEKWQEKTNAESPAWSQAVGTWLHRFALFASKHGGKRCQTLNDITPKIASEWLEELKKNYTWETVSKIWGLMRGMYTDYVVNYGMKEKGENPFKKLRHGPGDKGNERVPHRPLTTKELQRLFECAQDDKQIYPLLVTAACTGMRIGDVCNLKWENVNLKTGVITIIPRKTRSTSEIVARIPIFGRLQNVLNECAPLPADGSKPSEYVFPQAAERYARNPDGIYIAVKPYFARAVFGDEPEDVELVENTETHPRTIEEVLAGSHITEAKQARMISIYHQLKSGKRSSEIATALGIARGQVSMYLAELEALTGEALRPKAKAHKIRENQRSLVSRTRGERGVGMRAASLYGWHSLRATFVVLAVEAGISLEDVRKIVGHTTVEMTREYYNPKEENVMDQARKQMQKRTSVLDGDIPPETAETTPAPIKPTLDEMVASMTPEQRSKLAKALLSTL